MCPLLSFLSGVLFDVSVSHSYLSSEPMHFTILQARLELLQLLARQRLNCAKQGLKCAAGCKRCNGQLNLSMSYTDGKTSVPPISRWSTSQPNNHSHLVAMRVNMHLQIYSCFVCRCCKLLIHPGKTWNPSQENDFMQARIWLLWNIAITGAWQKWPDTPYCPHRISSTSIVKPELLGELWKMSLWRS